MKTKRLAIYLVTTLLPLLGLSAQDMKYIVHSSGMVLGLGSDNRAVLVQAKESSPMELIHNTDGTCFVALNVPDATFYLQLGTANGWSTYFLNDKSTNRARYTIEQDGQYVRLKNKETGKYLGTDATTAGSSCFSDKSGTDAKHRWRLSETSTPVVTVDTLAYPIVSNAERQLVEGWGVSLCWWAGQVGKWSQSKMDQMLKWMVSPTGLNWNLFRYNIGGGDDPKNRNCNAHHMDGGKGHRAEMEGFQDERGGEYHWERDSAQRRIMLRIKELRPDAQFEAFSNSCPWWMTESGCVSGSKNGDTDNLKKDYYKDFAQYLVDVCKHYKEQYGIEFKTLEPFNEANTNYWKQNGGQEGCHFSPQSQIAFLKVLIPILKESGLQTRISASDETNVGGSLGELNEYIKANMLNDVAQWNTHTYGADTRSRSQVGSLARSKGLTMWMSETGSGGSGIGGNLAMTKRLFDDMRYIAPDAWMDWQYMEEANDQWCMIKGKFDATSYQRIKNYYVRQQVTRFIKPGSTIVTSLNENSLAAIISAKESEDGANSLTDTLVVCLLNEGDKVIHRLQLPLARIGGDIDLYRTTETENLKHLTSPVAPDAETLSTTSPVSIANDSTLTVMLPPQSITTVLIPIRTLVSSMYSYPFASTEAAASGRSSLWQPTALTHRKTAYVNGSTYLIIPQSNHTVAVCEQEGTLSLASVDISKPSQLWTIEEQATTSSSSKTYIRLRNGLGHYATAQSSYAMKAQNNATQMGLFSIENVDGLHVRIMQKGSDKGWDLNNQNLTAGTSVGSWTYGGTATTDTRQWLLVRVASPDADDATGIDDANIANSNADRERSNVYYDLQGRRIATPQAGHLYIRGGRKILFR